MEVSLVMANQYHCPPNYWLEMPLVELLGWIVVASELIEREKTRYQKIGPGL